MRIAAGLQEEGEGYSLGNGAWAQTTLGLPGSTMGPMKVTLLGVDVLQGGQTDRSRCPLEQQLWALLQGVLIKRAILVTAIGWSGP